MNIKSTNEIKWLSFCTQKIKLLHSSGSKKKRIFHWRLPDWKSVEQRPIPSLEANLIETVLCSWQTPKKNIGNPSHLCVPCARWHWVALWISTPWENQRQCRKPKMTSLINAVDSIGRKTSSILKQQDMKSVQPGNRFKKDNQSLLLCRRVQAH